MCVLESGTVGKVIFWTKQYGNVKRFYVIQLYHKDWLIKDKNQGKKNKKKILNAHIDFCKYAWIRREMILEDARLAT